MLGGNIYRWLLLFQEFDFEIILKPSQLNSRANHLSRIESGEEIGNPNDSLLNAQLFACKMFDDHYRCIIQLLSMGYAPAGLNTTQKK